MLLVISPAKKLDYETPIPKVRSTQPAMLVQSQALIDDLQQLGPHEVSALMGISDKLGVLNYDRFKQWHTPFTKENARPAVFAFNGDVYAGLNAYGFDADDLKFAQAHLRILSGLYGMLRPLDLMQPYRLEMGTKFASSRGANLYDFWGELISQALNKQLNVLGSKTLVNLASIEYFKAVKLDGLQAEVITPLFKERKNGQYKIISFSAKKARGLMSAYIIRNKLTDAAAIKHFDDEGYGFNPGLSTETEWVFTRDQS